MAEPTRTAITRACHVDLRADCRDYHCITGRFSKTRWRQPKCFMHWPKVAVYKIDIEEEPDFLRFRVTGEQNTKNDSEIDAAIAKECIKRDAGSVLVDIRGLSGRLSIIENHVAAASFRERMPISVRSIAIVDAAEHSARSAMYELTAQNRGVGVKFFERVEDAEAWLRNR